MSRAGEGGTPDGARVGSLGVKLAPTEGAERVLGPTPMGLMEWWLAGG